MKESIVRLRALEKQRFAYRYALNVVDFDAETVAPDGSADGRAEACEVLSRADFDLLVNDNTAALLRQLQQPLPVRGIGKGCKVFEIGFIPLHTNSS